MSPGTEKAGDEILKQAFVTSPSVQGMRMAAGSRWTRSELLVALNVYHKLPFGLFHQRQPVIADVARRLGRSPSSLAMKLSNFASLDPVLKLRNIKGLSGASALDISVWNEFHEHLEEAAAESEQKLRELFAAEDKSAVEVVPPVGVRVVRTPPVGSTDATGTAKARRGQEYFRQAVLNNFDGRCGVTGLAVRELLVASHILPWSKYEAHRLSVSNGLSLSRLHDAAFDQGLIGFDDSLRLVLSRELVARRNERTIADYFCRYEGQGLQLPADAVMPDVGFLAVHLVKIFKK